jgi:ABC-2 type transport system ATP-binding protein
MMNAAVEAVELCKKFIPQRNLRDFLKRDRSREILAVNHVSLLVEDKEIFGLVGPNGAGKTTLINLLCTVIIPTSGAGRVGGRDVIADAAEVRRSIGLVTSNERSFYWRLTGRQNISFFADLYSRPPKETRIWIEELLEVLDLRDCADQRFDSYSTGIRQRLAMARALLHKPKIIFMDEPTKGLDPTAAAALIRLIRERLAAAWSPTIIVTSHNLREIEQLCSRVAIMHLGRILCCGPLAELSRHISPYLQYQLTVGGISREIAEKISTQRGVVGVSTSQDNGSIDLKVQLTGEEGALSAVLRTVLANGGEVHYCSALPVSLEDVFSHVVSTAKES